jgi:hypothetical protein
LSHTCTFMYPSHGTHLSHTCTFMYPHPTLSRRRPHFFLSPTPTYPGSYSASHGGPAAEEAARHGDWPREEEAVRLPRLFRRARIEYPRGWRSSARPRWRHRSSHPKAVLVPSPASGGGWPLSPRPYPSGGSSSLRWRRPLLRPRRWWLGRRTRGRRPPLSLHRAGARGGGGLLCLSAELRR